MRRLLFLILLLSLLMLPAYATENNDFFNLHASECVYDGRDYLVNDPHGYLSVLEAPYGRVQDNLLNEQSVTVYALYTDSTGALWAQLRYTMVSRGIAFSEVEGAYIGWAPLASLSRDMDKDDFLLRYGDEFVNRPMRFRPSEYPDTTLWAYPGAEQPSGYLRWYIHESDTLLSFPAWWQDAEGKRWALWEDHFICLSDPERLVGASMADSRTFYPAVALDELPIVVEAPVIVERPSPLPYYLMAVSAVLVVLAIVVRKFTNTDIERK